MRLDFCLACEFTINTPHDIEGWGLQGVKWRPDRARGTLGERLKGLKEETGESKKEAA